MNHRDHSNVSIKKALPLSFAGLAALGLVHSGAAQASLLGDEVQLDVEFQGDSLTLDAIDISPDSSVTVGEDGVVFTDPPTLIDFNEVEFLSAGTASGASGLSSSFGQSFFNLED
ncbi:MAG: hypothetical protein AAFO87_16860, partial [Cyanobacteria bacterium J06607_6]